MTTQAKNKTEELLIKAQAGEVDSNKFIEVLMESQIFVPLKENAEVGGLQSSNNDQPLVLKDESGVEVMILFTSPERSKNFIEKFPDYDGGLLAEFKWIVEHMGIGYAFSINPDDELGFDLQADVAERLANH
ncbi:MAG TPA: SseB family protein [Thiothrix sp.]|nr:SseB family protein [Thiothrix sp.]